MVGQNTQFNQVQPGALITDILLNSILDKLESLDSRITTLESLITGGTSATITSIVPPGPLRVGQEIQVLGRNLGFLAGTQRVFLDNTSINIFKAGSNDSKLIFDIPDLPGIPVAGRQVVLTVANQFSSDSRTIVILPALHGNIAVTFLGVTPTTPTPNQPATFHYRLQSNTDLASSYAITASVTIPEWNNLLQLLDDSLNVVSSGQISVDAGQQKDFFIRITSIPAGSTGTLFSLTVSAQSGTVIGSSGQQGFEVGQPAEPLDNSITFLQPTVTFIPDASGGAFDDRTDTISLKQGFTIVVAMTATCSVAGTYDATITSSPSTTNWTMLVPTDQKQFIITQQQLTQGGGKVNQEIDFKVKAEAGASATGQATFRLQREGLTSSQVKLFPLVLKQ